MAHRRVLPAIALLVVLAGCGGPGIGGQETLTPAPVPTVSAAPSDASGTPTAASDRPTDAAVANTRWYAALDAEERAVVDAALAGHARFAPIDELGRNDTFDTDALEPFLGQRYLVHEGTYYEIEHSVGRSYASYHITVRRATEPRPDAPTVEELPGSVRPQVRWAIENGSYATPFGKWSSMPEPLANRSHVRANGTTYRLQVAVGDAPIQRLHLEPVD